MPTPRRLASCGAGPGAPWVCGCRPRRHRRSLERPACRRAAGHRARRQEPSSGYSGIRIDSQGRRLRIESARRMDRAQRQRCGLAQAACCFRWGVALRNAALPAGLQGVRFSVLGTWRVDRRGDRHPYRMDRFSRLAVAQKGATLALGG